MQRFKLAIRTIYKSAKNGLVKYTDDKIRYNATLFNNLINCLVFLN
jgi:hypothetical protein